MAALESLILLNKSGPVEMAVENDIKSIMVCPMGMTLDGHIRQGVPLSALDRLSEQHGVNAIDAGVLSARALRRRKASGRRLSHQEGDHLYRLAYITVLAEQVLGGTSRRWLEAPRKALGGRNALEAAATTAGYEAVEELLLQVRHGFCA